MKNSKIEMFFPTVIFVRDNILIDELKTFKENILEYFDKNKTEKTFDGSMLDNSFFKKNNIFSNYIYKNLLNEIKSSCVYYCQQLGFSENQISKFDTQNIWANLIKKYDYHNQHIHSTKGQSLISGVFYIDAPESAKLKFESPFNKTYSAENPVNVNELNFDSVSYACLPGRLLLFRGYTLHGYDSHLSDHNKISIAFNFGPI